MANSQELIGKVTAYVEQYMNKFDGSHDFNHIKRVVGLAREIYSKTLAVALKTPTPQSQPQLDLTIITLCALLHDVGDRKYLKENEDANTLVLNLLLEFGASRELAEKVQTICSAVSYSNEVKDEGYVRELVERWPELGVVQDADRLDSLGAVGLGRIFTYGGARISRGMDDSMSLLDIKLFKLEGMMKTDAGREMARVKTERLRVFQGWWREEMGLAVLGEEVLGV